MTRPESNPRSKIDAMTQFAKTNALEGEVRPVTREALEELAKRHWLTVELRADGIAGRWGSAFFEIAVSEDPAQVLSVDSLWDYAVVTPYQDAVLEYIDSWNRDNVVPAVSYVRHESDGSLGILTHADVDIDFGATEAQLAGFVAAGVHSALVFHRGLHTLLGLPLDDGR